MTIETEIRDVVMSQEMQEECDCLLVTIPMEHIISLSFILIIKRQVDSPLESPEIMSHILDF